jgi:DMSO/TMAO reductase YedYZ heme-binding membrane subunit
VSTTVEWILIRATGLTAVVALSASMILGLMLSLRIRSRRWPAVVTNDLHRYVTGLALWITGAHLALLVLDSYVNITLRDLFVPFVAGTRTVTTGLGTIAFLTMTVMWFTSIYRDRIGQRTWRKLHYLTFLAYVMAMAHGIFGGTDTRQIWAWPLYAASLVTVGALTWRRVRTALDVPAPSPRPAVRPERPALEVGERRQSPPATRPALPAPAPVPGGGAAVALPTLDTQAPRTTAPPRRGPVRL